jgi:hypothetical protein
MKLRYKLQLVVISIVSMLVIDMQACLTTLIYDKAGKIMVYNRSDKTFILIRKNGKRRFGNQHQPANFALYIQQPNKPVFSRIYTCIQNACSKSGNIQLKFSDIENGTGAARLFHITKNEPHSSMAQTLPMMQKKCMSCGGGE